MTRFEFSVLGVEAARRAVSPTLIFRLSVRAQGEPVDALALRARVQLEPAQRTYAPREETLVTEIFGTRERWSSAVRPLQWHEASIMLGRFSERTEFTMHVPCTYDMNVSASRYLGALEHAEIPIRILFNGTVFRGAHGGFQVEMLPWDLDCTARFPIETFREAMDACFPGHTWIRVERATFDKLSRARAARHLRNWDETLNELMGAPDAPTFEGSAG